MNQSSPHWLNLQTMILQLIMCHTIKIRTNISCNQIKVRESARYQANIWWASYLFTYLRDIDPTQLSQSRKYNTEHFPKMPFILYGRNYSNISFYIAITNMEIHISRSFFHLLMRRLAIKMTYHSSPWWISSKSNFNSFHIRCRDIMQSAYTEIQSCNHHNKVEIET